MYQIHSLLLIILSVTFSILFEGAIAVDQEAESDAGVIALKENIDDFESDFDANFKDLQAFIEENLSLADSLDIIYLLFTPENRDQPYKLNPTQMSLQKSKFNSNLSVKFLIHGFGITLSYPNNVLFLIKEKLLDEGDYNVIVANYTQYSLGKLTTAVRYSYLVARNLRHLIQFLMSNTGISKEKFHLIGHSLGGQVAGHVGNQLPNLARITALDPGGPIFTRFPPAYRINYKSAKFVDVIHTSAAKTFPEGLGLGFVCGNQDFFPNGGTHQPGCANGDTFQNGKLVKLKVESKSSLVQCNHIRAEFLFAASISSCQFLGVKCNSYEDFNSGRCVPDNSNVAVMGFHAKPIPDLPPKTKFYFNTTSETPYCNQEEGGKGNILQRLLKGAGNIAASVAKALG